MKEAVKASVVKALAAEGLWQSEIARRLGVSRARVSQVVKEHGIECSLAGDRGFSARAARLAAECEGMTRKEAQRHLGVSMDSVLKYAKATGFEGFAREVDSRDSLRNRVAEAAPNLAAQGLSKSEAARSMGIAPPLFISALARLDLDIQWRSGNVPRGSNAERKRALTQ